MDKLSILKNNNTKTEGRYKILKTFLRECNSDYNWVAFEEFEDSDDL